MSMCIAWKTCFESPNFELFTLFFEAVQLLTGHPEPSFPGLVIRDGFQQFFSVEIGPEGFSHIQLCIGNLPEKEVGDAEFATRPDEQIRVRNSLGPEVLGESLKGDLLRSNLARLKILKNGLNRVENLRATS